MRLGSLPRGRDSTGGISGTGSLGAAAATGAAGAGADVDAAAAGGVARGAAERPGGGSSLGRAALCAGGGSGGFGRGGGICPPEDPAVWGAVWAADGSAGTASGRMRFGAGPFAAWCKSEVTRQHGPRSQKVKLLDIELNDV